MAWTQVSRRDRRKTWGGPISTDADGNRRVVGRTSVELSGIQWPDISVPNTSEITPTNSSVTVYRGIDGELLSQSGSNTGVWYIRPSWQAQRVDIEVDYGTITWTSELTGGGVWTWTPGDAETTTFGEHECPATINVTLKALGITLATNSFTVVPTWVPLLEVTKNSVLTPARYPPLPPGETDSDVCHYFDDSDPGTSDTVVVLITFIDYTETAAGSYSQTWATSFGSGTFATNGGFTLPHFGVWKLTHTGLVEGDAGEHTITMTNQEGGVSTVTYELCWTPPSGEVVPGLSFDQATWQFDESENAVLSGGWTDDLGNVTIEVVSGGGVLATSALTETTGTFSLTFTNAQVSDEGPKVLKITDANGNEVEAEAHLTVNSTVAPPPPGVGYTTRWELTTSTLSTAAYAAWLADNNKFTTTDALGFDGGRRSLITNNAGRLSLGTGSQLLGVPRNDPAPTFDGSRFEHYTKPSTPWSSYDSHSQHYANWSDSSQLDAGYQRSGIDWRWSGQLQFPTVTEWENHAGFVIVWQAYMRSPLSPAINVQMRENNGVYHWRFVAQGSPVKLNTAGNNAALEAQTGFQRSTFLGPPVVYGQVANVVVEYRIDYTGQTGYARFRLNGQTIGETASGHPIGIQTADGKNRLICFHGFYSWNHGENYIDSSRYPRVYFYSSRYESK